MGVSGSARAMEVGMCRTLRAERGTRIRGIRCHAPLPENGWDEGGRGPGTAGSRLGAEAAVRGGVRQGRERELSRFTWDPLPGVSDPVRGALAQTPEG